MVKVGVTGGIGSGKTTVCKMFASMGIPIYYADKEAKRLMNFDTDLKNNIKKLLGEEAYHNNGRLHRANVAQLIFNDKKKLEALNQLVHPAVRKDADEWHSRQDAPYTIQEAALFVENGSYKLLDKLIVVTAPEELRIQRVMKRDNTSKEKIQQRIRNQMDEQEKVKKADFVLSNDGKSSIIQQIHAIHKAIITIL